MIITFLTIKSFIKNNNDLIMSDQPFNLIQSLNIQSKKRITDFLNTLLQKGMKPQYKTIQIKQNQKTELQNIFKKITLQITATKARQISRIERSQKLLTNNEYNYGQIEFKTFSKIIDLLRNLQLLKENGEIFYDLGSGSGKVLIAAALCFGFKKCVGIQLLKSLYEISNKLKDKFIQKKQEIQQLVSEIECNDSYKFPLLEIINSDFKKQDWSQATLVFASSTCYSPQLMRQLCYHSRKLKQGTIFITLTKKLQDFENENIWKCIHMLQGQTSWGNCTIYVQQKLI